MKKLKGIIIGFIILFVIAAVVRFSIQFNINNSHEKEIRALESMKSPLLISLIDAREGKNIGWVPRTRIYENPRWGLIEVCYPISCKHAGWINKRDMEEAGFKPADVSHHRNNEREVRNHLIKCYMKFPGNSADDAHNYLLRMLGTENLPELTTMNPEIMMKKLESIWIDKMRYANRAEVRQYLTTTRILTNFVMTISAVILLLNIFLLYRFKLKNSLTRSSEISNRNLK